MESISRPLHVTATSFALLGTSQCLRARAECWGACARHVLPMLPSCCIIWLDQLEPGACWNPLRGRALVFGESCLRWSLDRPFTRGIFGYVRLSDCVPVVCGNCFAKVAAFVSAGDYAADWNSGAARTSLPQLSGSTECNILIYIY